MHMAWLDDISLLMAIIIALVLGLAPFFPEPHLFEKMRMLKHGTLVRPVDIFDLLLHLAPFALLLAKLARMALVSQAS